MSVTYNLSMISYLLRCILLHLH